MSLSLRNLEVKVNGMVNAGSHRSGYLPSELPNVGDNPNPILNDAGLDPAKYYTWWIVEFPTWPFVPAENGTYLSWPSEDGTQYAQYILAEDGVWGEEEGTLTLNSGTVTTEVGRVQDVAYAIRAAVAKSQEIGYALMSHISREQALQYAMLAFVARGQEVEYAVRSLATHQQDVAYSLRAWLDRPQGVAYGIGGMVAREQPATYAVRGYVERPQEVAYAVEEPGFVSRQQGVRYGLAGMVSRDQEISYGINGFAKAEQEIFYAMRATAARQQPVRYLLDASLAIVSRPQPISYSIDGVTGPCPTAAEIADAVWSRLLGSGATSAGTLLAELHQIHGLVKSAPLQVSESQRISGEISQNIQGGATTTVTRL
jgi:hypothetical protein